MQPWTPTRTGCKRDGGGGGPCREDMLTGSSGGDFQLIFQLILMLQGIPPG